MIQWTSEPIPGSDNIRLTERLDLNEIRAEMERFERVSDEDARAAAQAIQKSLGRMQGPILARLHALAMARSVAGLGSERTRLTTRLALRVAP